MARQALTILIAFSAIFGVAAGFVMYILFTPHSGLSHRRIALKNALS